MNSDAIVYVVDDDAPALKSLCYMIEKCGYRTQGFSSPTDFLEKHDPQQHGCLIVDLRMPEMTGLELQNALISRGSPLPLIVVTGFGNIAECTQAFKAGAVDFLEKPVDSPTLLDRIKTALVKDFQVRSAQSKMHELETRLALLTPREREVMDHLIAGKSMKEIAAEFGTSFQTIAKHRMKVLEKLGVENDIELVHLTLPVADSERRTSN